MYHGKSVFKAVDNVNKVIAPQLIAKNFDVREQFQIDEFMIELDGTENKGWFFLTVSKNCGTCPC